MNGKGKSTVKRPRDGAGKPATQAAFDAVIAANQEIQKRHAFGTEPHRRAYEAIRKAVKDFHGKDIGDYED
jgi:hypothetical protein